MKFQSGKLRPPVRPRPERRERSMCWSKCSDLVQGGGFSTKTQRSAAKPLSVVQQEQKKENQMRHPEKICHYSGIKQMDIMFGGGGGYASSTVCKPVVHLHLIQAKDHAKMRIREVRSRLKQKVCSCSLLQISFLSLLGND